MDIDKIEYLLSQAEVAWEEAPNNSDLEAQHLQNCLLAHQALALAHIAKALKEADIKPVLGKISERIAVLCDR